MIMNPRTRSQGSAGRDSSGVSGDGGGGSGSSVVVVMLSRSGDATVPRAPQHKTGTSSPILTASHIRTAEGTNKIRRGARADESSPGGGRRRPKSWPSAVFVLSRSIHSTWDERNDSCAQVFFFPFGIMEVCPPTRAGVKIVDHVDHPGSKLCSQDRYPTPLRIFIVAVDQPALFRSRDGGSTGSAQFMLDSEHLRLGARRRYIHCRRWCYTAVTR